MASISAGSQLCRSMELPCKYQTEDVLGGTTDKAKRRKIMAGDYIYCDRLYRSNIN